MTPITTIQLDPETAKALADYAAALGLSVEEFLKRHFGGTNGFVSVEDADRWLDDLDLPPLPRDFSIRHIYADHDWCPLANAGL